MGNFFAVVFLVFLLAFSTLGIMFTFSEDIRVMSPTYWECTKTEMAGTTPSREEYCTQFTRKKD